MAARLMSCHGSKRERGFHEPDRHRFTGVVYSSETLPIAIQDEGCMMHFRAFADDSRAVDKEIAEFSWRKNDESGS
jgi:hypothetical protein